MISIKNSHSRYYFIGFLIIVSLMISCSSQNMVSRFKKFGVNIDNNAKSINGTYKINVYDNMPGIFNLWWLLTEDEYQYERDKTYHLYLSIDKSESNLLFSVLRDSISNTILETKHIEFELNDNEWLIKHRYQKDIWFLINRTIQRTIALRLSDKGDLCVEFRSEAHIWILFVPTIGDLMLRQSMYKRIE